MVSPTEGPAPSLQQQALPTAPSPQPEQGVDWDRILDCILTGLLVVLFGPIVFRARALKAWVQASAWEAHERQRTLNGSAFLYLLLYIPIFLFHQQIAWLWRWLFALFSQWTHLPLSAWIGTAALWPPLSSTLYRWLLSIPLTYLLARTLQAIDDYEGKTAPQPARVLLPEELVQLAPPPKAKQTNAPAHRTSATNAPAGEAAPPRKKRKSTTRRTTVVAPAAITPKPDSLWSAWNVVPETDPRKQALRQAAQEQEEQGAGTTASPTSPHAPQPVQQTLIIEMEPEPPQKAAPEPAPQPGAQRRDDEDDYDWQSGEGTLSL
jgi:hypothetical protein